MPKFYIDCEGAQAFVDYTGSELPDKKTAEMQAIMQSGEIMRDHAKEFSSSGWWRVTLRDDEHRPIMIMMLDLTYPEPD